MNSADSSRPPVILPPEGIRLEIRRNVPSLNILFKMNPWERAKEKREMQMAVLDSIGRWRDELRSLLPVTEPGRLIQITCALSMASTAFATLQSYLMTDRKTSTSGSSKSKLTKDLMKKLSLQFHQRSKNKKPPNQTK